MGLSLRGTTSGAVDINAPAVAGDNTITLPGTNGAANQFYKNSGTAGIVTHSSMVEDSSGNIGIGTDNPQAKLNIINSSSNTPTAWIRNLSSGGDSPALRVQGGANNNNSVGTFEVRDYDGNVDFKVGGTGRVGIGTDNPTSTLSLGGNMDFKQSSNLTTTAGYLNIAPTSTLILDSSTGDIQFRIATSERMRLDSSGRLLVGTSSARDKYDSDKTPRFQVEGTTKEDSSISITRWNAGITAAPVLFFGGTNSTTPNVYTLMDDGEYLGEISFEGADGSKFVPGAKIEAIVDGTPGADDMPGRIEFSTTADGASSPTERMRIQNNGMLSYKANQATQAKFGVIDGSYHAAENTIVVYGNASNNSVLIRACNTADGTPVFDSQIGGSRFIEIEASGDVNSQGPYTNISDQRLKENIIDSPSQWDDVKALRVRKFNFTEASGYPMNPKIGFIAQEVEQVSPGLVKTRYSYDEDGQQIVDSDMKLVKTTVITTKAIKALQEAMARIETLETQNADLLARVTALEG